MAELDASEAEKEADLWATVMDASGGLSNVFTFGEVGNSNWQIFANKHKIYL